MTLLVSSSQNATFSAMVDPADWECAEFWEYLYSTVPTLANLLPPRIRERQSRREWYTGENTPLIPPLIINQQYNRQAFPDPRTPLSQSLHYSEVVMLVGLIQAKLSMIIKSIYIQSEEKKKRKSYNLQVIISL